MRSWLMLAALLMLVPSATAQTEQALVKAEVHIISIGDYDTAHGTYVLDFYLHLEWLPTADANFTAANFEFMNGRAGSTTLLTDETLESGARSLWYRIQADLYSQPDFANYPFDGQSLVIEMEDALFTSDALVYTPGFATVDENARVAGWRMGNLQLDVADKTYPFGETYSRITFTLPLEREKVASGMRAFLPPLAFMLVASFSFFFDRTQAANRLALGTGMLITAVGFHVSQSVSLPALGALTLFDRTMISVYAFIATTILVTAIMAFEGRFRVPEAAVKVVQKRGVWLSFAVPVVVFLLLLLR